MPLTESHTFRGTPLQTDNSHNSVNKLAPAFNRIPQPSSVLMLASDPDLLHKGQLKQVLVDRKKWNLCKLEMKKARLTVALDSVITFLAAMMF